METGVKEVELRDLWRRYKETGDKYAREQLVLAFSPLVKYVAGRMSTGLPAHVEEADLISYGLLGLISAIERYDLRRACLPQQLNLVARLTRETPTPGHSRPTNQNYTVA